MTAQALTPLHSLLGGAFIGLAASLLLLTTGRVAGVSTILGGVLAPTEHGGGWRGWFLGGLVLSGLAFALLRPASFAGVGATPLSLAALSGLLVGFGTRLGGGCTSGHGVCGLARFSPRSIVATMTFIATGAAIVYVLRHVPGAGR